MGEPNPSACPHCGDVFDARRDTASHMTHKADSDHPEESYAEALSALNKRLSAGQEGPDNPLLRVPDSSPRSVPRCPECGGMTERVGSGLMFKGVKEGEKVTGTTDDGTRVCHECDILVDDETVIRNVN
jgi:hypothetical protein